MENNLTRNGTSFTIATLQVPLGNSTFMLQVLFYLPMLLSLVALIKGAANTMLLVVLCRDRLKTFRNRPTTLLLGNLSVTALTTSLTSETVMVACFFTIHKYLNEILSGGLSTDQLYRKLTTLLKVVFVTIASSCFTTALWKVSILTVLVFTFVQLLVISSPLRYGKFVTRRKVQWSLAIIWIYSLLASAFVTGLKLADLKETLEIKDISPDYSKTVTLFTMLDLCLHFVFVPFLTIVTFIFVYRAFRHQAVKGLTVRSENPKQLEQKRKEQHSQRNYLNVSLLLIISMFLFASPKAVAVIITVPPSSALNEYQRHSAYLLLILGTGLLSINQILDTVVFAWRFPQYRKSVNMLFLKKRDHGRVRDLGFSS